jgi:hypothetical protein
MTAEFMLLLAQGWGLHVWGDVAKPTEWQNPLPPSG